MNPENLEKPVPPTPETTPPPFSVKPEPPTAEMLAVIDKEKISQKAEEIDLPEKSRLDEARIAYLAAKSELDKKNEYIGGLKNFSEEEKAQHFELDPNAKKILEKFNLSREEYFSARGEALGKKLEDLENEFRSKGMSEEEYSKEMKKASSAYLISEFKNLYDAKTEILAAQKQSATPWLMKKLYEASDEYRKMPLKKKLIISGALIAGGVVAGAVSGGAGAALAAVVGGGKLSQRMLSSTGAFIGIEALIKKSQQKEFESAEKSKLSEVSEKVVEAAATGKKDELIKFLKSRDRDLESMGWGAEKDLRDIERQLANRRYFIAGTLGALMASGLTAEALANIGSGLGIGEMMEGLSNKLHTSSPSTTEAMEIVAKESKHTVTIDKGGSIAQAARTLVKEGKLSSDQFKQAWESSFVDIKGIKVPLKDISLVHSGDQVVYVEGTGGSAGHFEVVDYAKDKLSLGTNQDLLKMYEAPGKEAPVWLQKAVAEDISDAFNDNNFDANDARVIEFHYANGSLKDQLEIEEKLFDKMGLPEGRPFSDMFVKLSSSSEHAQAMRIFEKHLSEIGFDSAKAGEYEAIKNVRIGDLLEKRGRSWFKDYFFSSELTDKNGENVSKVGMGLQRKLVEYVRSLVSTQDKKLTVEQFLQKIS